jgi:hypothetical protein
VGSFDDLDRGDQDLLRGTTRSPGKKQAASFFQIVAGFFSLPASRVEEGLNSLDTLYSTGVK